MKTELELICEGAKIGGKLVKIGGKAAVKLAQAGTRYVKNVAKSVVLDHCDPLSLKVGDFVQADDHFSMVLRAKSTDVPGLLVSLKPRFNRWLYEFGYIPYVSEMGSMHCDYVTDATDYANGMANQEKINALIAKEAQDRTRYRYQSEYYFPIFQRVPTPEWYIPAIEELKVFLTADGIFDRYLQLLDQLKRNQATDLASSSIFWSSTEYGPDTALSLTPNQEPAPLRKSESAFATPCRQF